MPPTTSPLSLPAPAADLSRTYFAVGELLDAKFSRGDRPHAGTTLNVRLRELEAMKLSKALRKLGLGDFQSDSTCTDNRYGCKEGVTPVVVGPPIRVIQQIRFDTPS